MKCSINGEWDKKKDQIIIEASLASLEPMNQKILLQPFHHTAAQRQTGVLDSNLHSDPVSYALTSPGLLFTLLFTYHTVGYSSQDWTEPSLAILALITTPNILLQHLFSFYFFLFMKD